MWYPWKHVKGFARAMIIFATVFLVSTGLCGMNLEILTTGHGGGGSGDWFGGPVLTAFGMIELLCMLGSFLGMVITGVAWIFSSVFENLQHRNDGRPSITSANGDSKNSDGKQ